MLWIHRHFVVIAVPSLLFGGVMGLSCMMWWHLDTHRTEDINRYVHDESRQIAGAISKDIEHRIESLQWFVNTWEQRGDMSRSDFDSMMSSVLLNNPGYQAIQWVAPNMRIKWHIPLSGNESVLNLNVAFDEQRRIALERARHMKIPTMTPAFELVQGTKGFIVYFPIHIDGKFNGFLRAVFQTERWLDHVWQDELSNVQSHNFNILVQMDGVDIYKSENGPASEKYGGRSNMFIALDHKFTVNAIPGAQAMAHLHNPLPEITLAMGFLISVLLGFVALIYIKGMREKQLVDKEKTALQLAAAEREITQQNFRHRSDMQKILMSIATNYINVAIDELESSIQKALGEMALFVHADRAYVFHYDLEADTASNTHEWCQFGIEPEKARRQDISLYQIQDWYLAHQQGNPIQIELTQDIPQDQLRNILEPPGIKSLLAVPMIHHRTLLGFVGFEWISERRAITSTEFGLLNLFSEILVNIHQRSEAENRLLESRDRMQLALQGTNSGLWDWHIPSGNVIFDERWAEIAGYCLNELDSTIRTWEKLCHPDDFNESNRRLKEHFEKKTLFYECETRLKHKNGEWVWVLDRGRVVEWDKNGAPIRMTGTHLDISELKRAQAQLQHLANHDELTELPTRRLAQDRGQMAIQRAMRTGENTAFLFVDLDGFKLVNDTFGHEMGDNLLKEIAHRLLASVRKSDTVARIGGDEFLIILDSFPDITDVQRIATAVIEAVLNPIEVQGYPPISIGCSIGIAIYPQDGSDFDHLIHSADVAMYQVKSAGKNHFQFARSVPPPPSA